MSIPKTIVKDLQDALDIARKGPDFGPCSEIPKGAHRQYRLWLDSWIVPALQRAVAHGKGKGPNLRYGARR
jgi:hypothetical protein